MKNIAKLCIVILLFLVYGCGQEARNKIASPTITLTWQGYDGEKQVDPNKAEYILNGKKVGQGQKGLAVIIAEIKDWSSGTELLVFPDRYVYDELATMDSGLTEPRNDLDPVPFRRNPNLYQQLKKVAQEHNIAIWYLAGPPGKGIVDENGKDFRVRDHEEDEEENTDDGGEVWGNGDDFDVWQ